MTKSNKNISMLIILAVFFGIVGIIYFAYTNWSNQQEEGNKIIATMMNPYFEAIKKQEYESVYNLFFSIDFKKRYSLKAFVNAHQGHKARFGKLLKWENRKIEGITEIGSSKYLRLMYGFYFDREKNVLVAYDIIKKNNKYYINESYYLNMAIDTLTREIW
ncbi:MAG: hypothetical protein HQK76_02800 [Desulfobacterales bacterium]|nr:hypothetical protein [Desulfobacterales bacterium]